MKIQLARQIKNKLFNLYSYLLNKKKRKIQNTGLSKSRTIGIIFTYKDAESQEKINNFIRFLKKLTKKVYTICFINTISNDYNFKYPSFNYNDVNFKGKILDKRLQEFLSINFDYLYLIQFEINPLLKYIVAISNSKCKIGYYNEEIIKFVDIMIKTKKNDLGNFIEQLIKYSEILQS